MLRGLARSPFAPRATAAAREPAPLSPSHPLLPTAPVESGIRAKPPGNHPPGPRAAPKRGRQGGRPGPGAV